MNPAVSRTLLEDADKAVDGEDNALTDRISELQGLMVDRHSEYWSGPKADTLQQEYRDLIELRDKEKLHDEEELPLSTNPA
jgi:hypothetical protein